MTGERPRISALIELGAGFHPEISGRENVFINGIMLGLSETAGRASASTRSSSSPSCSEFIDAPVKTYSSGMYMRLGFAVAIHVDPDVLLVDEVLAVGDEGFTHKCLDKFGEFRRRGRTILLVTHSLGLVERFCDEALWLDEGMASRQGDPMRVVGAYVTDVGKSEEEQLAAGDARAAEQQAVAAVAPEKHAPKSRRSESSRRRVRPADMFTAAEGRWGSREIEIAERRRSTARTARPSLFFQYRGPGGRAACKSAAGRPITDFVFGIGMFNADGVCCYGTNT